MPVPRRKKKKYSKPKVKTEKVFETAALACGKCISGPTWNPNCGILIRVS